MTEMRGLQDQENTYSSVGGVVVGDCGVLHEYR